MTTYNVLDSHGLEPSACKALLEQQGDPLQSAFVKNDRFRGIIGIFQLMAGILSNAYCL